MLRGAAWPCQVRDIKRSEAGRQRAKTEHGWVSIISNNGTPLLEDDDSHLQKQREAGELLGEVIQRMHDTRQQLAEHEARHGLGHAQVRTAPGAPAQPAQTRVRARARGRGGAGRDAASSSPPFSRP